MELWKCIVVSHAYAALIRFTARPYLDARRRLERLWTTVLLTTRPSLGMVFYYVDINSFVKF